MNTEQAVSSQYSADSTLLSPLQKIGISSLLIIISGLAWMASLQTQLFIIPIILDTRVMFAFNFVLIWTVMMVAMMLPSIIPMVLLFAKLSQSRVQFGYNVVPTFLFVLGYFVIWGFMGFILAVINFFMYPILMPWNMLITGSAFVLAGLYQSTKWKNLCLGHCRSPIHFLSHGWHDGLLGAIKMGSIHGIYCVGCCWGLMVALIAAGMMNPAYMGLIGIFIFIEKISSKGEFLAKIIGYVFVVFGLGFMII
ncbi:MAG: hypothetical protein HeimC2_36920 [Candidatus Heimdallarchaeota archaeon LC_2]|nr:MAG: hypothetical protein HeimC2_44830 [Candidatus Heimdallarchaeota archaeon LC_2]OLS20534.1 MAG: hypothetical protein HeimC2_36920 [Candidatus Heimdallarchaeota archaeon LC_2]